MITNIFVNFPVRDLQRSKQFFGCLGLKFNPQFTDENAACLIFGPNMYAMLLVEKYFNTFTTKVLANTQTHTEVITALFVENRAEVDEFVNKAMAAGGMHFRDPEDMGFMYSCSFQDLDGHLWEVGWMDPAHIKPLPA